jgi:hypothetical protein
MKTWGNTRFRWTLAGRTVNTMSPRVHFEARPFAIAVCAVALAALPAAAPAGADIPSASRLEPRALTRARTIRLETTKRYQHAPGLGLRVSEASSTGVLESFTLLTPRMDEARIVSAENGIYFAVCPVHAVCPYPGRRFARPAADFAPRRLALELALRTFTETSANLVAVSLPTPRFTLFVAERSELAQTVDMPALAEALGGNPARAPARSLRGLVDRLTRPRVFVAIGLEPTPSGGDTLSAYPLWPMASPGG